MQLPAEWRMNSYGGDNLAPGSGQDLDGLFERLVRDHSPRLQAIARGIVGRRFSPEDVVQQALANLYEHRARYDWSEPLPLLRRAVVNEALRLLRRPAMTPIDTVDVGQDASPDRSLLTNELVEQVRRAIDQLPDHFRAALVLCEYERMSYPEIAQELGITLQQTKTWIFRARRQLEQKLADFVHAGGAVKKE
jgi:RNA polymerase sigma-70 factor (ECF subfamily)